jgi:hypothetical protein
MDPEDDNYDSDAVDEAILASFKANYEKRRLERRGPPITVNIPQELYTNEFISSKTLYELVCFSKECQTEY